MECHEPAIALNRRMESGDVRKSNYWFSIAAKRGVIEVGEKAHRSVSAAHAPQSIDPFARECGIDVLESVSVGACEISKLSRDMSAGHRRPSERADIVEGALEIFSASDESRRRDQRNARTFAEWLNCAEERAFHSRRKLRDKVFSRQYENFRLLD